MEVRFKIPGLSEFNEEQMNLLKSGFITPVYATPDDWFVVKEVYCTQVQKVINKVVAHVRVSHVQLVALSDESPYERMYALLNNMPADLSTRVIRLANQVTYVSKEFNPRELWKYIQSASYEIRMKYCGKEEQCEVKIGDVVDFNYGVHFDHEISGGHVFSVVCDVDEEGVFVLPISKRPYTASAEHITYDVEKDIVYDIPYSDGGGTVLVKHGRYLSKLRVNRVLGHVTPEFYVRLVEAINTTMNFTKNMSKIGCVAINNNE